MRVFAAIWRILTLTCDESTRLMSASLDEPLPWTDRAAVALHAGICRACRRFRRQIRFLREAARIERSQSTLPEDTALASLRLSDEARCRMEARVRREVGKNSD